MISTGTHIYCIYSMLHILCVYTYIFIQNMYSLRYIYIYILYILYIYIIYIYVYIHVSSNYIQKIFNLSSIYTYITYIYIYIYIYSSIYLFLETFSPYEHILASLRRNKKQLCLFCIHEHISAALKNLIN